MRISQAIKLGHRSLAGHRRRNLTTIIIIGVTFGFMMGVIFLTQGAQNAIRRAADDAIGENYYLGIETDFYNKKRCHEEPIPDQPNAFNIICEPHDLEQLQQKVQAANGEILATSTDQLLLIPPEKVAQFITVDMDTVPDDVVPVLLDPNMIFFNLYGENAYKKIDFEKANLMRKGILNDDIGHVRETLYVPTGLAETVGVIPNGSIHWLSNGMSLNPLDFILDFLGMNSTMYSSITLDNGSTAVREYAAQMGSSSIAENMLQALLRFDSFEDAQRFAEANTCQVYESSMGCEKEFFLESMLDNRVALAETADLVWWGLGIAEAVLIIIAVVITFFTLLKVLHNEKKTIALYYSLGASTGDVMKIYLSYMLEVCLLAVGFAVLLGLGIAVVVNILNASAVADLLTVAYVKDITWPIILVGWNFDIAKIIIVMLLVAPVTALLCMKMLSKR